jgi:hypothetical protein
VSTAPQMLNSPASRQDAARSGELPKGPRRRQHGARGGWCGTDGGRSEGPSSTSATSSSTTTCDYYKKQPKGNIVRDSYFCELGILLLGWLVLWSICSPFLCSKICLRLYYELLSLTMEVVLLSAIRAHVRSMTLHRSHCNFPLLIFEILGGFDQIEMHESGSRLSSSWDNRF